MVLKFPEKGGEMQGNIRKLLAECDTGQARRQWREIALRAVAGLIMVAVFAAGQVWALRREAHYVPHDVHVDSLVLDKKRVDGAYGGGSRFGRELDPEIYSRSFYGFQYSL